MSQRLQSNKVVTSSLWLLSTWDVSSLNKVCQTYKMRVGFQIQYLNGMWNTSLIISYWWYVDSILFWTYLDKHNILVKFTTTVFISWFLERKEGERKRKIDGKKKHLLAASCATSTGDQACNQGMWPDWESNQQPFRAWDDTQPTVPSWPGHNCFPFSVDLQKPLNYICGLHFSFLSLLSIVNNFVIYGLQLGWAIAGTHIPRIGPQEDQVL